MKIPLQLTLKQKVIYSMYSILNTITAPEASIKSSIRLKNYEKTWLKYKI